jgi:transcriptional regulator with XRE-family HTH domain
MEEEARPDLGDVLASNVRGERSRRRLRQADLAERLGIAASTVSAIEAGKREPLVRDLPALCRALNCTVRDLFRDADESDLRDMGLL